MRWGRFKALILKTDSQHASKHQILQNHWLVQKQAGFITLLCSHTHRNLGSPASQQHGPGFGSWSSRGASLWGVCVFSPCLFPPSAPFPLPPQNMSAVCQVLLFCFFIARFSSNHKWLKRALHKSSHAPELTVYPYMANKDLDSWDGLCKFKKITYFSDQAIAPSAVHKVSPVWIDFQHLCQTWQ